MSLVYIDLGNTTLKLYSEGGRLIEAFSSLESNWIQAFNGLIEELLVVKVVIASVASDLRLSSVLSCFSSDVDVVIVNHLDGDWLIAHGYTEPGCLGIDRLLAIEAAYRIACGSVVVIDCGSAITVDVVSNSGKHLGGYIVPGYRLQQESLIKNTALNFNEQDPALRLGLDTTGCIQNGILRMITEFCQGVIDEVEPDQVFVTGGDLKGGLSSLVSLGSYDELLVYKGMKYVYGGG